jgi:hypothetical protein
MNHPAADDNFEEKIEKMVTLTVGAAKGLIPPGQVALPLAQIAASPLAPAAARDFARALNRVIKGERDPITLARDLTPEFSEILWDALAQIDAPLPDTGPPGRVNVSFEELVEKVAQACSGEVLLWQQLWDFTGELAGDADAPAAVRALGTALQKILAGERQTHVLDELAEEHRWAVAQLLEWLSQ